MQDRLTIFSNFYFYDLFLKQTPKCNMLVPDTLLVSPSPARIFNSLKLSPGTVLRKKNERANLMSFFKDIVYKKCGISLQRQLLSMHTELSEEMMQTVIARLKIKGNRSKKLTVQDYLNLMVQSTPLGQCLIQENQQRFQNSTETYKTIYELTDHKQPSFAYSVIVDQRIKGTQNQVKAEIRINSKNLKDQLHSNTLTFIQYIQQAFFFAKVKRTQLFFLPSLRQSLGGRPRLKKLILIGVGQLQLLLKVDLPPKLLKQVGNYCSVKELINISNILGNKEHSDLVSTRLKFKPRTSQCRGDFCNLLLAQQLSSLTPQYIVSGKLIEKTRKISEALLKSIKHSVLQDVKLDPLPKLCNLQLKNIKVCRNCFAVYSLSNDWMIKSQKANKLRSQSLMSLKMDLAKQHKIRRMSLGIRVPTAVPISFSVSAQQQTKIDLYKNLVQTHRESIPQCSFLAQIQNQSTEKLKVRLKKHYDGCQRRQYIRSQCKYELNQTYFRKLQQFKICSPLVAVQPLLQVSKEPTLRLEHFWKILKKTPLNLIHLDTLVVDSQTAILYRLIPHNSKKLTIFLQDMFDSFTQYQSIICQACQERQCSLLLLSLPGQAYSVFDTRASYNNLYFAEIIDRLLFRLFQSNIINLQTDISLIGVGMGGFILQTFAGMAASLRLNKILLINSFVQLINPFKELLKNSLKIFEKYENNSILAFHFFSSLSNKTILSEEALFIKLQKNPISNSGRIKIIESLLNSFCITDIIKNIQIPILSVFGKSNCLIEQLQFQGKYERQQPLKQLQVQGGHGLLDDNPDALRNVISQFLSI